MNLFLIRWSLDRAAEPYDAAGALGPLSRELGSPGSRSERWSPPSGALELFYVSLPPATGGVDYVYHDERRMALFAGRPIQWRGDFEADGRRPLSPRGYLEPGGWDGLDGRYAAARYDDTTRVLEVRTDALGAYPLYAATAHGSRWISNSAELLRRVGGGSESDPFVIASLVAGGWSLTGHPRWAGVRRLPRGVTARFTSGSDASYSELLPIARIAALMGSRFDADGAARTLVAGVGALADWPGRRSVVPVTGGRDSRLVLAAALRSGIDFEAVTYGEEGDPEVEVARRLCDVAGVSHAVLPSPALAADPRRVIHRLQLTTSGTASLEDTSSVLTGEAPPALWHSGQGGEIARAYYVQHGGRVEEGITLAALADRLFRYHFTGLGSRTEDIVSAEAKLLLNSHLEDWVREQADAGVRKADIPDSFYLLQRMAHWAAPRHGHGEHLRDTTSPLWGAQLLPYMLGAPPRDRARELFHLSMLRSLGPDLLRVPFGKPWPASEAPPQRAVRSLRRVAGIARRRLPAAVGDPVARTLLGPADRAGAQGGPQGPLYNPRRFPDLLAEVREQLLSSPNHDAFQVLDRKETARLLESDPVELDSLRRWQVCRLATLFLAEQQHGRW